MTDTDSESQYEVEEMKGKKRLGSIFKKSAPAGEKTPSDHRDLLFIIIIILLTLQLAASTYQIYSAAVREQRAAIQRQVLSKSVASYTANLDALTTQMLKDYKDNVYNNTNVDTSSKQQVLGNEYNFNAIMLLIKQNSRLMEVIAQTP
jgi:flagellar basal body-associated protein FliL